MDTKIENFPTELYPELLVALHKEAFVAPMARMILTANPLSIEQARQELELDKEPDGTVYFDYVQGRGIKTAFPPSGNLDFRLYDRDAGAGTGLRVARRVLAEHKR